MEYHTCDVPKSPQISKVKSYKHIPMKQKESTERKEDMIKRPIYIKKVSSEMGRTRWEIECPFCHTRLYVYVWSFSGSGKNCDCGAKLGTYCFHKNYDKTRKEMLEISKSL